MRLKHQPQKLPFWLHQTGAQGKVSLQRAGGQRDHVWLTLQWHKKLWKPTSANSVGLIQLLSVVANVVLAPSSVPSVIPACTPDTPSTTEMPVLQDSSSHCPQQHLYWIRPFPPVVSSGLWLYKIYFLAALAEQIMLKILASSRSSSRVFNTSQQCPSCPLSLF